MECGLVEGLDRRCLSAPPSEDVNDSFNIDLDLELPSDCEQWDVQDVAIFEADLQTTLSLVSPTEPVPLRGPTELKAVGLPAGSPEIKSADHVDVNTKEWTLTLWPDSEAHRYEVPTSDVAGEVGRIVIDKLTEFSSENPKTGNYEWIVLRNMMLLRQYVLDVPAYFNTQIFDKSKFVVDKMGKDGECIMYDGHRLGIPYVLSPLCSKVFEVVFNPSGKKQCSDKMLRQYKLFRRKYLNQLSAQRTNMANIRMRRRFSAMQEAYEEEHRTVLALRANVMGLESVVSSRDAKIGEQQQQIAALAQRVFDVEALLKTKRVQCEELKRENKRLCQRRYTKASKT